jgi:hypothetical protein
MKEDIDKIITTQLIVRGARSFSVVREHVCG